jgi:Arc/MetJ-type ribon-helix-helix transcriptional regulator
MSIEKPKKVRRHFAMDSFAESAVDKITETLNSRGLVASRSEAVRFAVVKVAAEIAPITNTIV